MRETEDRKRRGGEKKERMDILRMERDRNKDRWFRKARKKLKS